MIVVISSPSDPHAERVVATLRADGQEVLLLDLSDLPDRATLTIDYDGATAPRLRYSGPAGPVDLSQAQSVWWRRPQAVELSAITDPDVVAFTYGEWQEAINGMWQLMDAPWMNPPARDEVAARKALQLRVAAELGLRVPRTLITSNPAEARAFIDREGVGRTIYKTFSCTHAIWRETRLVGPAELDELERVRLAPVIFQEFIPAGVDLRVTAVGGRLFPAAIDPTGTDYDVDFRMSLGQAQVAAAELPAEVEKRLLALMERLGLVYGAIDVRRTPDGEHVFLEVNTAGEFLFVEDRTGQPITRALADWLATPL